MLATKLGGILANRTLILGFLVASLLVASVFVAYAASISTELGLQKRTIDLRDQEVEQYLATMYLQRNEIATKSAQLDGLHAEISAKSLELEALGLELSDQSQEIAELQQQAARLQTEISILQSKIKSDELYVEALSKQLENVKRVKISHYSLAVINEVGIVFPIEVEIINSGIGAISVDVSNVQYETGFQSAVRIAAYVASEYTGVSISDKDIIVRVINDQSSGAIPRIDGASAGALISGMIVAGLTDKGVSDKVMVTGTINPNGTIGKVGSIEEKTEAALDFGAIVMLVPEAQEFDSARIAVIGILDIDDVVRYLVISK